MRMIYGATVLVGIALCISNICAYALPNMASVFLSFMALIALVLAFVATAIMGAIHWRKRSRWWLLPSATALFFIVAQQVTPRVGVAIADWYFKWHLDQFNRVVEQLRRNPNICRPSCDTTLGVVEVPEIPSFVMAIRGARCRNGDVVVVAFRMRTDGPGLHEGYVFNGANDSEQCLTPDMRPETHWRYIRHVVDNWYHFSDQPNL